MNVNNRRCSNSKAGSGCPENQPACPAWRLEFANLLHRQFKRMQARQDAGQPIAKHLRVFSWYWSKRFYRTAPDRRVSFSVGGLKRLFLRWKQGGCVRSALLPQYRPAGPSIPLWVYLRFLSFVCRVEFPTLRAAHAEFCRRGGWVGRGRQPGKPVALLSYGQLQYYFPGDLFHELQARRRAIAKAQTDFAETRIQAEARLRADVPDRPQRRRRTGAELSLEAAGL